MHDAHYPGWRRHLIELPYFVHWCACVVLAVPAAICLVWAGIVWALAGQPNPALLPARIAGASYAVGLLISSWGIYVRRLFTNIDRREHAIANLPREFEGYRIAHLSDLHIGALTPQSWGERWVRQTNALKCDLIVITGDLVTNGIEFHSAIAAALSGLRARDGVLVTFGNHDYFGEGEPLRGMLLAAHMQVLSNASIQLQRGHAVLNIMGCDDTYTKRANLNQSIATVARTGRHVLLAHDPDLWLHAREQGVSLTLSGHTHGGQVAVPFLGRWLSLSHLAHRFHTGVYRDGAATLYVSPGLGTTGPPIRLGSAPTIGVHTLRCQPV
jgi:uncharacterized protein